MNSRRPRSRTGPISRPTPRRSWNNAQRDTRSSCFPEGDRASRTSLRCRDCRRDGIAVFQADDACAPIWRDSGRPAPDVYFSTQGPADLSPSQVHAARPSTTIRIATAGGRDHRAGWSAPHVHNALAARLLLGWLRRAIGAVWRVSGGGLAAARAWPTRATARVDRRQHNANPDSGARGHRSSGGRRPPRPAGAGRHGRGRPPRAGLPPRDRRLAKERAHRVAACHRPACRAKRWPPSSRRADFFRRRRIVIAGRAAPMAGERAVLVNGSALHADASGGACDRGHNRGWTRTCS